MSDLLLFTFRDADTADRFDLTRLGAVDAASPDGLQVRVEPHEEWATAANVNLMLMTVGLYDAVIVTTTPDDEEESPWPTPYT